VPYVVNKVTLAYLTSNLSALLLDELWLHDIGKKWHCDILFFHDIYYDIKTISPDDLNSFIWKEVNHSRMTGVVLS